MKHGHLLSVHPHNTWLIQLTTEFVINSIQLHELPIIINVNQINHIFQMINHIFTKKWLSMKHFFLSQ